jgi:hypothetical protein
MEEEGGRLQRLHLHLKGSLSIDGGLFSGMTGYVWKLMIWRAGVLLLMILGSLGVDYDHTSASRHTI